MPDLLMRARRELEGTDFKIGEFHLSRLRQREDEVPPWAYCGLTMPYEEASTVPLAMTIARSRLLFSKS